MGDLEGLPFSAYSAIGLCARALDRIGIRYESVVEKLRLDLDPP